MRFQVARNMLMHELGWSRKVATLAVRLATGIDTWDSIDACVEVYGTPLLSEQEKWKILIIGLDTILEEMNQPKGGVT